MAVEITRDKNPILGEDFYLICHAKRTKKGPLDLTGAKIYVTLKDALSDEDASADLQVNSTDDASYFTTIDAEGGKFEVAIPGSDIDDLTADTDYYVDVKIITSAGALVYVVYDKVRFDQAVTRATS